MDLTKGPILKVLTKLALPIMASAFLATAYNITDMAWIGMLGSEAVAGIGVGGMYMWLSSGLATLARTGGQVHVAQSLGKGDRALAVKYATASLQLALVFGALFGAVCLLFTDPLIAFFRLNGAKAIAAARVYIQIACGAVIFSYVGIALTGLYTAQGDSKTPLKANFIGLVFNMILDPFLILGVGPFPRLEMAGAAIATVIAQVIVVTVLLIDIGNKKQEENVIRQTKVLARPEASYVGRVVRLGGPIALQSTLYCGISMILTRLVTSFGDGAIAAQRVGGQIESLSWNAADGFSSAINAFAAQNFGAKKIDRVKRGYNLSVLTMGVWGALVGLIFLVFPRQIASIFFHEADVIKIAVDYLRIIGIGEAFMCVELMGVGAISGLGNTKICSIISVVLTGMRIPLAYILSGTPLQLNGIWWALTISSICKGFAMHVAFRRETRAHT